MAGKLLSATILFRHGARGPGDSELSAFNHMDEVISQWQEHDLENLTHRGSHQISELGAWFARRFTKKAKIVVAKPFFRGSIADRAVDSAKDFVCAFNAALGFECAELTPTPYAENPDCYFRPWKMNPESGNVIKHKMEGSEWEQQVQENSDFLARISEQSQMKPDYCHHLNKVLLSTTHLAGLLECEAYWPQEEGIRNVLQLRIPDEEDKEKIHRLACYVWQERYLITGLEQELGGWILLDMIQAAFDENHNLKFFSGHDYTILVLLAAGGFLKSLTAPIEFGAYVIFELWDSPPGPHSISGGIEIPYSSRISSPRLDILGSQGSPEPRLSRPPTPTGAAITSAIVSSEIRCTSRQQSSRGTISRSNRVLRVLLNRRPFNHDGSPSMITGNAVCDDRVELLCDLSMEQVSELVSNVVNTLSAKHGLPSHWQMPQFF